MYQVVHPLNVDNIWHLVAPWIAQAIGDAGSWVEVNTIKESAKNGGAKIWIGRDVNEQIDVVLVSETWMVGGRQTLVLRWLCGKNMEQWFCDLEMVEEWAAANGYHAIHIWGRAGWKRVCKPLGYIHETTVISKSLIRGLH